MTQLDPGNPRTAEQGPLRRFTPADSLPHGRRALLSAVVSFAVACGLTFAQIRVVVGSGQGPARAVLFFVLGGLSVVALMLGSSSLERGLEGVSGQRKSSAARLLYWLATSIVALSAVVISGAVVTLLVADVVNPAKPTPGEVAILFVGDALAGAVLGALAVLLILLVSQGLGWVIGAIDRLVRPSPKAERRFTPSAGAFTGNRDHVLRGAALGSAGLVLSAVCTALFAPGQTGSGVGAPPDGLVSFLRAAAVPVAGWLVGSGIAWLVWEYGIRGTRTASFLRLRSRNSMHLGPHPRVQHGTHASALALSLMAIGTFAASSLINSSIVDQLSRGRPPPVSAVTATNGEWTSSAPYLASRFEPVFWLTRQERWSPTSVSYYLQHSRRISATPACSANGCLQLDNCPDTPDPKGCPPRGSDDPALYYRYVDAADPPFTGIVDPSGDWKLIQYWIFYNYDSLSAGAITQWHESDWEQVTVLVQRTGTTVRPVEVDFSEHCYGARLDADRVRWSGSHPISYVGTGSHANYPRPGSVPVRQLRCSLGGTPHYLGVAGLFFTPAVNGASLELPVDYLLAIRDQASDVHPAARGRLIALDTTTEVSGFYGDWGPDNNLTPFGLGPINTGGGPRAPEEQSVSKQPFGQMLCDAAWLNPGGALPGWICTTSR